MNEPMWYSTMLNALEQAQRTGNDAIYVYDGYRNRLSLEEAPTSDAKSIEFRLNLSNSKYTTVWDARTGEFICQLDTEEQNIAVAHALKYDLAIKGIASTYGAGETEWDSEWSDEDDEEEDDDDEDEEEEEEQEYPSTTEARPTMLGLSSLVRSNAQPIYNPRTKEQIHPNDALISVQCRDSGVVMQMERSDEFTPVLCQCHRLVRFLINTHGRAIVEAWMTRQPSNTIEVIEPEVAARP